MSISVSVKRVADNNGVMTVEVDADSFAKQYEQSFVEESRKLNVHGFRRGRAPRHVIERLYGIGYFIGKAVQAIAEATYEDAAQKCRDSIVSLIGNVQIVQAELGKPLIYTMDVMMYPEVKLGQYKGLQIPRIELSVSEEEVNQEIENQRKQNSRLIDVDDRPVQEGDTVHIDLDGKVDGEPFEGGKAENQTVEIGSKTMVPGFEEQIIGHSIGEEFTVNVTLPDHYPEELKGKDAVFTCKVNQIQIREIPEANDEFAQDVSEFDSIAEYRDSLKAKILEAKEREAENQKQMAVVAGAVSNAEIDIPDVMVDHYVESQIKQLDQQLQASGITVEKYAEMIGTDLDKIKADIAKQRRYDISAELVLGEIAAVENITASDEEVDKEIEEAASAQHMSRENFESQLSENGREQLRERLIRRKTLDFLVENAVVEESAPAEQA